VIGHETGHNERRHTVTLPAKAQALDLLFGIASLFSPFIYHFGQLAEAGIIAKQSRADELQADQYGLQLMTRAGYDPEAMVSFMNHLGAAAPNDSLVDKYLEDHPGFPDRVSHLVGYDELDPTKRTNDQLLAEALHDQQTGRATTSPR
jgi:predicted Zn-dependent protease